MAGRGSQPLPASEKALRGTIRPSREAMTVDVPPAQGYPQKPTWLTPEGDQVWLDNIAMLVEMRTAAGVDSDAFGTYCNLQGRLSQVWKEGGIPPVAYLSECRKQAESFGMFGARSRLMKLPAPDKKPATASPYGKPQLTQQNGD